VNKLQMLGIVALTVVVFLLVASYFLAMLLGPTLFFLTPAGLNFSLGEVQPPILLFLFFGFYVPFALNASLFFMLLWGIFVLCFLAAWRLRESFHDVVSKVFSRPFSKLLNNWLFAMPIIASTLLTAVSFLIALQESFGVPTGAIPTPQTDAQYFDLYLSLSYASVIEEVGFRITPIGTFLLAQLLLTQSGRSLGTVSFRQRLEFFLTSFLYPDRAKKLVGGKNVAVNGIKEGISRGEWIMLLLTSLIFGAAHLISGIGWEAGKITSTFLQGFVFGVVYLAYGVQAPILLHWFFNYYFYSYELGTRYLSSGLEVFGLIEILTLMLGVFSLVVFAVLELKRILARQKQASSEPIDLVPQFP
jgi:membrane protease YdiL (CAAX protease family)